MQELAIKFCQQHKVVEKVKVNPPKQIIPPSTTVSAPIVGPVNYIVIKLLPVKKIILF